MNDKVNNDSQQQVGAIMKKPCASKLEWVIFAFLP